MPLVPLLSPELSLPEGLFSDSGGGVGGNVLRLIGGSDCCLTRLCKLGLTRFVAAYESFSSGLSSLAPDVVVIFLISAPVNPVNAFALSEAATSRALPK